MSIIHAFRNDRVAYASVLGFYLEVGRFQLDEGDIDEYLKFGLRVMELFVWENINSWSLIFLSLHILGLQITFGFSY